MNATCCQCIWFCKGPEHGHWTGHCNSGRGTRRIDDPACESFQQAGHDWMREPEQKVRRNRKRENGYCSQSPLMGHDCLLCAHSKSDGKKRRCDVCGIVRQSAWCRKFEPRRRSYV